MRVLTLLAASVLTLVTAGANGALADVLIKVDKATQRMSVSVDGNERHSWPVSTGLAGYATPVGSFTPFRLEEDHYSKEWDDAPMPHSIFFTSRGHAIHGSDATRRLGSPASHGCIRLSRANAAVLFDLVKAEGLNKTKIVVSGEESFATARKRKKTPTDVAEKRSAPRAASRQVAEGSPAPRATIRQVRREPAFDPSERAWPVVAPTRRAYAPFFPAEPRSRYDWGW